jgi:hypothetical protein
MLFSNPNSCFPQKYDTTRSTLDKQLTEFAYSFKAGYLFQVKNNWLDIGFYRQSYAQNLYYHPGEFYGTYGPSLSCEINLNRGLIGPKISYEKVTAMFFLYKASLIYYTDFDSSSLCIAPEGGITFLGFAVLSSRYSIPMTNKELLFASIDDRIAINLTINFPIKFKTNSIWDLRKKDD